MTSEAISASENDIGYSPINLKKTLSRSHDAIYVYAKNAVDFELNKIPRTDEANARYKNPDNDYRGLWKNSDMSVGPAVSEKIYEVITPSGRSVFPPESRCWLYTKDRYEEMLADNRIYFGVNGSNVPSVKKFLSEVRDGVVAMTLWTYQEVGHNQDAKKEVKLFNSDNVFATPKPEKLMQRILTLATNPNDLVLDSFLGSGTTAAVAHKMGRRWIGIEMGDHAQTHCQPRLQKVIDGEQGGISETVNWQGGGGFRFYKLGAEIFDANGNINPEIRFAHLAAHIWFCETKTAYTSQKKSPLLGVHDGVAYYLLYNGILGDKSINGGNVLTNPLLKNLPAHDGLKVIYGETSRISAERLKAMNIIFKQTPYDVKAR